MIINKADFHDLCRSCCLVGGHRICSSTRGSVYPHADPESSPMRCAPVLMGDQETPDSSVSGSLQDPTTHIQLLDQEHQASVQVTALTPHRDNQGKSHVRKSRILESSFSLSERGDAVEKPRMGTPAPTLGVSTGPRGSPCGPALCSGTGSLWLGIRYQIPTQSWQLHGVTQQRYKHPLLAGTTAH